MKTILVAGGAGEVGEGIVRQLLESGHQVVVQSRSDSKLTQLKQRLGEPELLRTVAGDINDERETEALRKAIASDGYTLDAVVAAVGSWWSGPKLVDLDQDTFQQVIHERLNIHFILAKTFLPDLLNRPGSSYTFIHSAAGFVPIPNSGPVSIAGAAQVMLKDVFAMELEGSQVSINLLTMMGSIATRSHPSEDPEALTNDDVGKYVSYLVSDAAKGSPSIKFKHRSEIPG
jgi:short-subunit dehydrogenase